MKIYIDDHLIYEFTDTEYKVLLSNMLKEEFIDEISRRIRWVLRQKYDNSIEELKKKWLPILKKEGKEFIPLDDEKFAAMIFAREDYKSRSDIDKPVPENVVK